MSVTLPDRLGRRLRDVRISVTDRCNFRCRYCMPKEVFGRDYPFLPQAELLTFEEITRLVQVFIQLGVRKVRLTGGEPLVRREIEHLIGMLAGLRGIEDLTLTTNGALLVQKARALRQAGLRRITVSLDALDPVVFAKLNDVGFSVQSVLEGIEAAEDAGFQPIKINMVVKRGVNDHQILPMARRFKSPRHILRFIEYMDVGTTNGWRLNDVVPAREIVDQIRSAMHLVPLEPNYRGEVARRYRYADGKGEIGLITSVSQPFCTHCSRARLTSNGLLYTCLFAARGHPLGPLLRGGADDAALAEFIGRIWGGRDDRYSEARTALTAALPKVEMSRIGG